MDTDPVLNANALRVIRDAIATAWPYINGVAADRSNAPWRIETARESLALLAAARELVARALEREADRAA